MAYRAMRRVLAQYSGGIEKDLRSYLLSPQEFMSKKVDKTNKKLPKATGKNKTSAKRNILVFSKS